MSRDGGAMAPLLRLARLGLGGPLGLGRQFWPWITLVDEVRRSCTCSTTRRSRARSTSPSHPPRAEGRRGRPGARPAPAGRPAAPTPALRLVVGEFAGEIMGSQRIVGEALVASGFVHEHGDLDTAARWLVA